MRVLGTKSTTYSAPRYNSVCPRCRPNPFTSVTVMPDTPMSDSAARTSSSLNGLMIAVTSFMGSDSVCRDGGAHNFAVFMPCSGIGAKPGLLHREKARRLQDAPGWSVAASSMPPAGADAGSDRSAILPADVPTDRDRRRRSGGGPDRGYPAAAGLHGPTHCRWRRTMAALPAAATFQEVSGGKPGARASAHTAAPVLRRSPCDGPPGTTDHGIGPTRAPGANR